MNRIWYGIIGSLILHVGLFFLLQSEFHFESPTPEIIEVSFLPKSELSKFRQQIVSEPRSKISSIPDPRTRLFSDKNRRTDKEQIKRGAQDAGQKIGRRASSQPPVSESRSNSQQPPSNRPKKAISSYRLSKEELADAFQSPKKEPQLKPARELLSAPQVQGSYRAFSRPSGSGARFLGEAGQSDHLPHLPDGDITLLNTKASKFAVFVRRVATRVFGQLRASGWESLAASDINQISTFSTVEAVLSPEGNLLKVKVTGPSGSRTFDDVLLQAAEAGASDPHPPPGARAADGNIHFLFKAKSWSRVGSSRGGKGYAEKRWLLLSTGLG